MCFTGPGRSTWEKWFSGIYLRKIIIQKIIFNIIVIEHCILILLLRHIIKIIICFGTFYFTTLGRQSHACQHSAVFLARNIHHIHNIHTTTYQPRHKSDITAFSLFYLFCFDVTFLASSFSYARILFVIYFQCFRPHCPLAFLAVEQRFSTITYETNTIVILSSIVAHVVLEPPC